MSMNKTGNHKQRILKGLEEKRDRLNKYFTLSVSAIAAVSLASIFLADRIEDDNSIVYSILAGAVVIVFAAFLVSLYKYRKADVAVNEQRKIQGPPVKEKRPPRFFSTPHPSWGEKLVKCVGIATMALLMMLIVVAVLDRNGHISYSIPEIYHKNYIQMAVLLAFIGIDVLRYRSGMSQLTSIVMWASVLFAAITVFLHFMGHQAAEWTMSVAFVLCLVNMFRVEREIYFLEQDDEDNAQQ